MQTFQYEVTDAAGLHARPAGKLVQKAKTFPGQITVSANGRSCDAAHLMRLMAMCVKCGTTITVTVSGENEEAFAAELKEFLRANL